jgi:hypothetical protein
MAEKDLTERAVEAVAENMLRRYEQEYNADHLTWRNFEDAAREDVDAVLAIFRPAANAASDIPPGFVRRRNNPMAPLRCTRCNAVGSFDGRFTRFHGDRCTR